MNTSARRLAATLMLLLAAACAAPSGAVAASGPTAPGDPDASALLDADRAFAADAAEKRLEGWMHWFAPNAAKVPPKGDVVQGLDAIRAADAGLFADPARTLHWEPELAGWLEPGKLGFTRGRYRFVERKDDAETDLGTGTYLTIWRLQPDGWRVILDTGIPDA